MFISDIKKKRRSFVKTAIVYTAVSVLCIVITNVYARFGHGVRSDYMDFMFLYPLLGGTAVFLLLALLWPALPEGMRKRSRMGYNLYNSGIACLTSAAMLTGIMEIAGTGSRWIQTIEGSGIVLLAAAVGFQIMGLFMRND